MLGLSDELELQINTLGTIEERKDYKEKLISYLKPNFNILDEDSKRRLDRNPLRILDSKNPNMQSLIANAPKLMDVIGEESKEHFANFCAGLNDLGIKYSINPLLVRGLDYYGHTVFEWVTDKLGSQATVCAGGRYDKLVEQLGGNPTPAVGFAVGVERLILLIQTLNKIEVEDLRPQIFIIAVGNDALVRALVIADNLRNTNQKLYVSVNTAGGSFKSQFKKADKSGARLALIIGEDELRDKTISIKDLRCAQDQVNIAQHELNDYITTYLR